MWSPGCFTPAMAFLSEQIIFNEWEQIRNPKTSKRASSSSAWQLSYHANSYHSRPRWPPRILCQTWPEIYLKLPLNFFWNFNIWKLQELCERKCRSPLGSAICQFSPHWVRWRSWAWRSSCWTPPSPPIHPTPPPPAPFQGENSIWCFVTTWSYVYCCCKPGSRTCPESPLQ